MRTLLDSDASKMKIPMMAASAAMFLVFAQLSAAQSAAPQSAAPAADV
jgi:hypothetical protein